MKLYLSSFRNGNQPDELIKLLGGKARTALIANATDLNENDERSRKVTEETNRLTELGLNVTEVDLRHYFGRPDALRAKLAAFDLIWVRGGNTFVLRRAFRMSGADTIIKKLLSSERIVYGGYSAGIALLAANLHGIDLVDDPHTVPQGYEKNIIWEGLGILPYSFVPHYKSDHPESADINRTVRFMTDSHIPFIALRDGEAIVINGNERQVLAT